MDVAGPRWDEVLLPVAVKRRRLAVDREALRERLRRCRQRLAGTVAQRRVLRHLRRLGHRRLGPIPQGLPVLPLRDRFPGRCVEELRSLPSQLFEGRLRVPRLPLRKFPLFFLPPQLFCFPLPPFCFPLPLGNLVRGPGQVRRHLPGDGLARERRDARREVFQGPVSLAPFPRAPFRLQRRSIPVELQRAAELAERFSELRPRARDTAEMNPVAILVRQQLRALFFRLLRPPRPGGVTGKGRDRRPGRRRASASIRSRCPAVSSMVDVHFDTMARSSAKGLCSSRTSASAPGSASFFASTPMRAISASQPMRWKGGTPAFSARWTCARHSSSTGHRAGFSVTAMSGSSHGAWPAASSADETVSPSRSSRDTSCSVSSVSSTNPSLARLIST